MELGSHKLARSMGLELIFETPDNTALLFCVSKTSEFGWD